MANFGFQGDTGTAGTATFQADSQSQLRLPQPRHCRGLRFGFRTCQVNPQRWQSQNGTSFSIWLMKFLTADMSRISVARNRFGWNRCGQNLVHSWLNGVHASVAFMSRGLRKIDKNDAS